MNEEIRRIFEGRKANGREIISKTNCFVNNIQLAVREGKLKLFQFHSDKSTVLDRALCKGECQRSFVLSYTHCKEYDTIAKKKQARYNIAKKTKVTATVVEVI